MLIVTYCAEKEVVNCLESLRCLSSIIICNLVHNFFKKNLVCEGGFTYSILFESA